MLIIVIQSPLRLMVIQKPNILNNLELICFWLHTFLCLQILMWFLLAKNQLSPCTISHQCIIISTQKIMWSRELPLNWSMARIGLRPARLLSLNLRIKILLSHSFMNFQFCDQLYEFWFQMSFLSSSNGKGI